MDTQTICCEKLREALLAVAKYRQFGPCWCTTIAGMYCVGQDKCKKASEALSAPCSPSEPAKAPTYTCEVCGKNARELDNDYLERVNKGEVPSRWRCSKHLHVGSPSEPDAKQIPACPKCGTVPAYDEMGWIGCDKAACEFSKKQDFTIWQWRSLAREPDATDEEWSRRTVQEIVNAAPDLQSADQSIAEAHNAALRRRSASRDREMEELRIAHNQWRDLVDKLKGIVAPIQNLIDAPHFRTTDAEQKVLHSALQDVSKQLSGGL